MSTPKQSIDEVLAKNGFIVISTSGCSMMPMLRDRRDAVEIRTVKEKPRKYDVVLYKREGQYVLHRIIKQTSDGYIIRGDNCVEKEAVMQSDVIGILFSFTRNGKRHTANDTAYIVYSRLTVFFHPIKIMLNRVKGKVKRIFRCR